MDHGGWIDGIFPRAGGAAAPIVDRIVRLAAFDKTLSARLPDGARAELQRLYVDTATSNLPENLGAIMRLAEVETILFGSDDPLLPSEATLPGLLQCGLSADLARIQHSNAAALFPRLAA